MRCLDRPAPAAGSPRRAVAWGSILVVALLPVPRATVRRMRGAGALSLAFVGLGAIGAPVPAWVPLFVLAAGVAWAAWRPAGAPS